MPGIHVDVHERLADDMREKIETMIVKLHNPPCLNTKVINKSNLVIIDYFLKELHHFQQQTGPFAKFKGYLSMPDAVNGNLFIRHQFFHCLTKILGFVACHNTSKQLGTGAAERSWSDVKKIKDGKRSNFGGISLEKRAILYLSARLNADQIKFNAMMISSEFYFIYFILLSYF